MSDFNIGWLFPDILYLHGERGNILALAKYAELMGLDNSVTKIDQGTKGFDPFDYDVLFMAPGEISLFPEVIDWLTQYKDELKAFIESGHPLIVTGTSVGIFCDNVIRGSGESFPGLGIISCDLRERDSVYGDDIVFSTEYNGERMELLGNQISMADLIIGSEQPFGEMSYGYGNTGKDKNEGVRKENSVFTNALGPLLVTNPWLTVEIIKAAAEAGGKEVKDPGTGFELEKKSFDLKKKYCDEKPKK